MSASLLEQVVAGRAPEVLPLSVDQFHRMIELGILPDGEPVELIDGLLVRKDRRPAGETALVHGPRHAIVVAWLQELPARLPAFAGHLRSQLPITLSSNPGFGLRTDSGTTWPLVVAPTASVPFA